MSEWKLAREMDQTYCEQCRAICPPIYELTYHRVPDAATQYHYVCRSCADRIAGQAVVEGGVSAIVSRQEAQRAALGANLGRDLEKRATEPRRNRRPGALEDAGGR